MKMAVYPIPSLWTGWKRTIQEETGQWEVGRVHLSPRRDCIEELFKTKMFRVMAGKYDVLAVLLANRLCFGSNPMLIIQVPSKSLAGHLEKSLMTDADLVKATFRLWDKDGNGVVSQEERSPLKASSGEAAKNVSEGCE